MPQTRDKPEINCLKKERKTKKKEKGVKINFEECL